MYKCRLRVSVPTKDQALQQVIMLKKELSELRAAQATVEAAQEWLVVVLVVQRFPRM